MSSPEVKERGVSIATGSELFLGVQPTSVFSTDDVLGQPPSRRKCWSPHEKQLTYHANYTRSNCLAECMAKAMKEKCAVGIISSIYLSGILMTIKAYIIIGSIHNI